MAGNVSKANYWQSRKPYRVLKDERVSQTKVLSPKSIINRKRLIFNIACFACNIEVLKAIKNVDTFLLQYYHFLDKSS